MASTGGLNGLWGSILKNWISPVFLAIVAVSAFTFIRGQQWTKLLAFLGIAAVVGALIFFGSDLFGQDGILSSMFSHAAKSVGNSNNSDAAFNGQ
jgi:hypothetical protein